MNQIIHIILIAIMVLNGLHFYGISAYAFINPEISENCTNGLDDDGDALVDIEDIEDCSLSPRGVNSSSSSTSSSLTSNSSSNSTSNHNPQAPTNSSIVFTPQV
jgi:hypothetical protein